MCSDSFSCSCENVGKAKKVPSIAKCTKEEEAMPKSHETNTSRTNPPCKPDAAVHTSAQGVLSKC